MRFLRYQTRSGIKPAILKNNKVYDISHIIQDINIETINLLQGIASYSAEQLSSLPLLSNALESSKIRICISGTRKVIAVGMNYLDHLERVNFLGGEHTPPKDFIFFQKPVSSITGPYDPIYIPRGAKKLDYENELGVVIGKPAKYINESEAMQYVAGFCIVNDVSERDMQLQQPGQYCMGKSSDSFCPIGPYIVTPDELDISHLNIQTWVNNQQVQNGSTEKMIFNIPKIISRLSEYFTLEPGDIISTGTPRGVKLEDDIMDNKLDYLKPEDVVRLEIEGLGFQENTIFPSE